MPAHRIANRDRQRCINPHCRSRNASGHRPFAKCLGLCSACYKAFDRLRKKGKITTEEAIARGICLPPKQEGASRFPEIAQAAEPAATVPGEVRQSTE